MNKELINQVKDFINSLKEDDIDYFANNVCNKDITNLETVLHQLEKKDKVINEAITLIRKKTKLIPFDKNGEGGGLELSDYDVVKLLEILEGGKHES